MMTAPDAADVATKESWPNLRPMPDRHELIPVRIKLNAEQARRVKQGFIPAIMEEKWFAYFADNTLYQHRSWTGFCIDVVPFSDDGKGGLTADMACVNRDPDQYTETNAAADIERVETMVRDLADRPPGATSTAVDPMVEAFAAVCQPNYLGSPDVVRRILTDYVRSLARYFQGSGAKEDGERGQAEFDDATTRTVQILSGANPDFVSLPWFSNEQLGKHLVRLFGGPATSHGSSELKDAVASFLFSFGDAVSDLPLIQDRDGGEVAHFDGVEPIIEFAISAILGTNDVHFPGVSWNDVIAMRGAHACTSRR